MTAEKRLNLLFLRLRRREIVDDEDDDDGEDDDAVKTSVSKDSDSDTLYWGIVPQHSAYTYSFPCISDGQPTMWGGGVCTVNTTH